MGRRGLNGLRAGEGHQREGTCGGESDLDGYGVRMAQNVTGDGVDVKPLGTIWR